MPCANQRRQGEASARAHRYGALAAIRPLWPESVRLAPLSVYPGSFCACHPHPWASGSTPPRIATSFLQREAPRVPGCAGDESLMLLVSWRGLAFTRNDVCVSRRSHGNWRTGSTMRNAGYFMIFQGRQTSILNAPAIDRATVYTSHGVQFNAPSRVRPPRGCELNDSHAYE
jgi:hypothetical protein